MPSLTSERAIADALTHGRALLKFISPNNVGLTGSHECGYYLPKSAWKLYTPYPPTKGRNDDHNVEILWPDGRVTESIIKWYGAAKSEYRLTRFGRDFPWLTADNVGDLLVLIPTGHRSLTAHVLDLDDDIADIQAALGVEIIGSWGIYEGDREVALESEDECVEKRFRSYAGSVEGFPSTNALSGETLSVLKDCFTDFGAMPADNQILDLVKAEYALFRLVERRLCESSVSRLFKSVDDFLRTAATIMNRRKSRAGRALENHVEHVLRDFEIPFDVRPKVDGRPDFIIPSKEAYDDESFPVEQLFMVGVKTTCKDRWRQVLNEAKRIPCKHLLTIQPGISKAQLHEMKDSNMKLIVPKPLQEKYPAGSGISMFTVEEFISTVRKKLE